MGLTVKGFTEKGDSINLCTKNWIERKSLDFHFLKQSFDSELIVADDMPDKKSSNLQFSILLEHFYLERKLCMQFFNLY